MNAKKAAQLTQENWHANQPDPKLEITTLIEQAARLGHHEVQTQFLSGELVSWLRNLHYSVEFKRYGNYWLIDWYNSIDKEFLDDPSLDD